MAAVGKSEIFKVIILGDGGVGKSSLMNRFVSNKFDSQSFHTIGVEFLNKDIAIGEEKYTIQIWDTAGQERFKSLRTPFYRGSDCCILTFGLDDEQSFVNLAMWRKEFFYYADISKQSWEDFPFVLLGNKSDVSERAVTEEEARQWCRDNGGMLYFETSAKTAANVAAAFTAAARRIVDFHGCRRGGDDDHRRQVGAINLQNKPTNKPADRQQGSCCS